MLNLATIPPHLLSVIVLVLGALVILAFASPLTGKSSVISGMMLATAVLSGLAGAQDANTRLATLEIGRAHV